MECYICYETFKEHNLIKLGCCAGQFCRDCYSKCEAQTCPDCVEPLPIINKNVEDEDIFYDYSAIIHALKSQELEIKELKAKNLKLTDEINEYRQSRLDDLAHNRYINQFEDATMRLGLIHFRGKTN